MGNKKKKLESDGFVQDKKKLRSKLDKSKFVDSEHSERINPLYLKDKKKDKKKDEKSYSTSN